jgi:hypothetical protein
MRTNKIRAFNEVTTTTTLVIKTENARFAVIRHGMDHAEVGDTPEAHVTLQDASDSSGTVVYAVPAESQIGAPSSSQTANYSFRQLYLNSYMKLTITVVAGKHTVWVELVD